jgi:hypothetical protein
MYFGARAVDTPSEKGLSLKEARVFARQTGHEPTSSSSEFHSQTTCTVYKPYKPINIFKTVKRWVAFGVINLSDSRFLEKLFFKEKKSSTLAFPPAGGRATVLLRVRASIKRDARGLKSDLDVAEHDAVFSEAGEAAEDQLAVQAASSVAQEALHERAATEYGRSR